MNAIPDRWVIEEHKHVHRIWIRLDKNHFAKLLKGSRARLPCVRKHSVRDLQPVHVSLILHVPAEAVPRCRSDYAKNAYDQQ